MGSRDRSNQPTIKEQWNQESDPQKDMKQLPEEGFMKRSKSTPETPESILRAIESMISTSDSSTPSSDPTITSTSHDEDVPSELLATVRSLVEASNRNAEAIEGLQRSMTAIRSELSGTSSSITHDYEQKMMSELGRIQKQLASLEKSVEHVRNSSTAATKTNSEALTALSKDVSSEIEKLTREVRRQGKVTIDEALLARVVGEELDAMGERSAKAIESAQKTAVASFADQMNATSSDVKEELAKTTKALERAEARVAKVSGFVSWSSVAKLAAGLLPFAVILLFVSSALRFAGSVFGIGPLFDWAWSAFETAETAGAKAGYGIGTFTLAVVIVWLIVFFGKKLYRWYDSL